jgi:hypothetical protein
VSDSEIEAGRYRFAPNTSCRAWSRRWGIITSIAGSSLPVILEHKVARSMEMPRKSRTPDADSLVCTVSPAAACAPGCFGASLNSYSQGVILRMRAST